MGNGLIVEELVVGDGDEAQDYNKVVVNYTGTLLDGSIFDSSLKPGRTPFTFTSRCRVSHKRLGPRSERNEGWR